jgi:hypothetical protein
MGLFILTETSAGYCLFKAQDKKLLKNGAEDLSSVEGAVNALKLKKFTVQLMPPRNTTYPPKATNQSRNLKMPPPPLTSRPP